TLLPNVMPGDGVWSRSSFRAGLDVSAAEENAEVRVDALGETRDVSRTAGFVARRRADCCRRDCECRGRAAGVRGLDGRWLHDCLASDVEPFHGLPRRESGRCGPLEPEPVV